MVVNDPRVHQLSIDNLAAIFSTDYWFPANGGLYRPLTTCSYLFNYVVLGNGANPAGYHWINFLLHWLNSALVFLLGIAIFRDRTPAFFAAALFAVHPVTTEAVTNIAGRADLMSACCVLAGLLLYLESKKLSGSARKRCLEALAIVSLAGVLAKENAAVLVGFMALYDLAFREHRPVRAAYVVVLASLVVMFVARRVVFSHGGAVPDFFLDNPLLGASFWTGRLTAVHVIAKELWILVWPLDLSASYSYNQIPMFQWTDWRSVASVAAVVALVAVILALCRWSRVSLFFLGWLLLALIPTANLLVLIGSIMAERFLYLPLVGFAGFVVFAVMKLLPKPAVAVLFVLMLAGYGTRTYFRNGDWQDNVHLWTAAEKVTPKSYATHLWLAAAWANQPPLGSEIDRAIAEGQQAVAIADTLPPERRITPLYVPLGISYRIKGSTMQTESERRAWYQKSVDFLTACIPMDRAFQARVHRAGDAAIMGDTRLYDSLGQSLLLLGENQRAMDAFRTLQRMAPLSPDSSLRVGDAWLAMGQPEQAVVAYEEAFILQPDHAETNRKLVELYPRVDTSGCAVDIDKRVNPFCATVQKNLCTAYSRLADVVRAQGNLDIVKRLRHGAVADGCE